MTAHRDLKRIIRTRQERTGESYTAARAHVMRARAERLALPQLDGNGARATHSVEAAVLKVNRRSIRARVLGQDEQITFRARNALEVAPGQVVTLEIGKRWTWQGDPYGTGAIVNPRIDMPQLGLEPLPLKDRGILDPRTQYEHVRKPDPYAPLWRHLTALPRACVEFDPIAWGALPGDDEDHLPVCDASDRIQAGDMEGAHDLLMSVLVRDLRCIDAHAHLGLMAFERSPRCALVHYEIGVRIGELSVSPDFDGFLVWGQLHNRPFLRCLHGYGLCLWRLGRDAEAERALLRNLALNPNDNQGVRFCWHALRGGLTWDQFRERELGAHGSCSP